MEILVLLLLFIILLFVTLSVKNSVNEKVQSLEREIQKLSGQLNRMVGEKEKTIPPAAASEVKQKDHFETGSKKEEPAAPLKPAPLPQPQQQPGPVKEKKAVEIVELKETISAPAVKPVAPPKPSFFEQHPDLEKFIGENLVNKIGIAILVLAIGFFVKYAIDNNWIGPVGRVGIGILCGGILVAVAHRLRNNYKGFSSVLVGGGLAVFYFTIALAYHQFHLFSQSVSFIIMLVITAFAVVLSLLYNRQELAVIALIGGFVTPFLVSNGSGNYKTLFTYLLVLNTGLLVIAYNKAWRLLNILAFFFTVILLASWIISLEYNTPAGTYRNGFLFASAFYLLFFFINIANNIKENKRFIAPDFGILLLNTGLYFGAGIYFLNAMKAGDYRGMFSAVMGVFNLAASYILFRNQKVDRNILYLLIGLTLSFVSLTAPIQLHGNYITLFWASETVVLYWLYQRSSIGIIKTASFIVWVAMLCSLVIDLVNIYDGADATLHIILNKGFITTVYAALACYALFLLKKKDDVIKNSFPAAGVFRVAGLILLYASGALEINYQFNHAYPAISIAFQYILLYSFAFVLVFAIVSQQIPSLKTSWQAPAALITICLFVYVITLRQSFLLLQTMLDSNSYHSHFTAHWIAALLAGTIFLLLVKTIRHRLQDDGMLNFICWLLCAWVVIFLSAESFLLVNNIYYTNAASWYSTGDVFVRTGLPILWGLCSFAFMWLGMRHKYRPLRIISLTLFSVTLIKLFAYDIKNIPVGGKIAAFFCLGVLLLVVSFMYQRLKRIIIEDEKKPLP
jgi:uncharacterized membrane protein